MNYIIIGSIGGIILLVILSYNTLVKRKNEVSNAFGSIDVMLKKRYDLIPNLVEVVKKYMEHEQNLLLEITKLRTHAISDIPINEKIDGHNEIQNKVNGLLMNVENYPNLKADTSFINLQATWTSSEEQISASRRYYNSAVTDYNNSIQMFPSNIIANIFNFSSMKVFEAEEVERKNVNAKELFNG